MNRFEKGEDQKNLLSVISIEKSKTLKYHIFAIKHQFFLLFVTSVAAIIKKYLRKENQLRYLLGLNHNMKE